MCTDALSFQMKITRIYRHKLLQSVSTLSLCVFAFFFPLLNIFICKNDCDELKRVSMATSMLAKLYLSMC